MLDAIEGGPVAEFIREKDVKARVLHRCMICDAVAAQPGDTYRRVTLVYDGRIYDWVDCQPCREMIPEVWAWASPCLDEGVGTDTCDEWAEEHPDNPLAVAYLARREAARTERRARKEVSRG